MMVRRRSAVWSELWLLARVESSPTLETTWHTASGYGAKAKGMFTLRRNDDGKAGYIGRREKQKQ